MSFKNLRHLGRVFVLSCCSLVITIFAIWLSDQLDSTPLKRLENSLYDLDFKRRSINKGHHTVRPDDVVIVDIDNASIAELGRVQSWPRLYDARVINHIAAGEPYTIGIDFLYTESDTLPLIYDSLLSIRGITNPHQLISSLSTDDSLAIAIRNAQNVYLSLLEDQSHSDTIDHAFSNYLQTIRVQAPPGYKFSRLKAPILPIDKFSEGARGIGTISTPTDVDGVIRQYQVFQETGHLQKDSVSLVGNFPFYMISDLIGATEQNMRLTSNRFFLNDSFYIPLNRTGSFRLNWLGSDEKFRYISFYKVYQKRVPSDFFKDKIVLLGTSASGMQDLKTAPHTNDRIPGVEVHATAILNIANQAYIREISLKQFWPALLIISLVLCLLFSYAKPMFGLIFLAGVILLELLAVSQIFRTFDTMIPITALTMCTFMAGLITNAYNYFTEHKQKRQLRNAFGTYVSSTVVNKIMEDPKSLMLGGTKKVLSVLFSDIRGFTKYSERMDPQLVVSIINKYLSAMSEPVLAHEGTIDKFIGDAIFAIFGAPLENSDHATEACEVALEMMQKLNDVNKDLISEGFGPLKIGIGLNTGEMTIGNIGSSKRFDYTAIGDSVNLGSRIEGLTKHFNVSILVSKFTKDACQSEQFLFRELPETAVQGKEQAVGIFELVDFKKNRALYEPGISYWEKAHEAFMNQEFIKAIELFHQYQSIFPEDKTTKIYLEKCEAYLIHPEEFSNVIMMDNK